MKGEMTLYYESTDADGVRSLRATSRPSYVMAYIKPIPTTPENPWGLFMVGVAELREDQKPQLLWQSGEPISITDDIAQLQTFAKNKSSGQQSADQPEQGQWP